MFTDTVGSTALGQANEAEALRLWDEQQQLLRPIFAEHRGREVKSLGDGFLVEFDAALPAVECALRIQQRIHDWNLQGGRAPLRIRVGVHLGDVEARGGDIFGDSVNVASRIEPLAEPGGICITEPVFGQVRNKLPLRLEKLPPHALKNVRFPFDVYRVSMPWESRADTSSALDVSRVAVMPLVNMISDPAEAYFADGMTEEIISAISQVRELDVISRTSVMQYKNTNKKVAEIGRELNVGTLLEGSVRKAGNRVRIAVQLIDANQDKHLWAENYDRTLEDVFSIQSDIAQRVASKLEVVLRENDRQRLEKVPTKDPEAHALLLKGRAAHRREDGAGLREALELYRRAVAKDPNYALAYAWLAIAHFALGFVELVPPLEAANEGERAARQALALDPSLAAAHAALAAVAFLRWDFEAADSELARALELDPKSHAGLVESSFMMRLRRRFDDSERLARRALELDPLSPETLSDAATDLLYLDRPDEAIALYTTVLEVDPSAPVRGNLGLAYVRKGKVDEGIAMMRETLQRPGGLRVGSISDLAYSYGKAGRVDDLQALLGDALAWHQKNGRGATALVAVYANLGQPENAFAWIEKAIEEHSAYLPTILFDFAFEKLWSEPRFEALKKRLGLG